MFQPASSCEQLQVHLQQGPASQAAGQLGQPGANQTQHQHQHQPQTTPSSPASNKRNPFCSRCRNHGKKAPVKGHKRHCEYRDCQCEGCYLVEQRQKISAAQIKRRRDQKQDEESGRQIKISPPVLLKDPSGARIRSLDGPAARAGPYHRHQQPQLSAGRHPNPNQGLGLLANQPASGASNPDDREQQQAAAAAALSNVALQTLAKFPNCMLSTINHHTTHLRRQQQQQHSPVTPTPAAAPEPALDIKPADQINLVERIQDEFGPLAVYAWLRAENFNAYKVLNSIELARGPFDELLQLNGHSPLDLTNPIVD